MSVDLLLWWSHQLWTLVDRILGVVLLFISLNAILRCVYCIDEKKHSCVSVVFPFLFDRLDNNFL